MQLRHSDGEFDVMSLTPSRGLLTELRVRLMREHQFKSPQPHDHWEVLRSRAGPRLEPRNISKAKRVARPVAAPLDQREMGQVPAVARPDFAAPPHPAQQPASRAEECVPGPVEQLVDTDGQVLDSWDG